MQRHSALTFQFPSACCICYFIPSHSAWEGFVLAPGGLLLPPLHTKPQQNVSERADKIRCIMGIWAPNFHSLCFRKCSTSVSSLWSLKIFSFSDKTLPYYSWLCCTIVLKLEAKSGHPAWDYCRRLNSIAAAPFLYSCTSAFGISKLFKHQNSLKSVHSH